MMSLRMTVKPDLTFATETGDPNWVRGDDYKQCRRMEYISSRMGEGDVFNLMWDLRINEGDHVIECAVFDGCMLHNTYRQLLLRPGVIILDDLNTIENPMEARVRYFRTLKFQEFLDEYRIYAVRRCNPNGKRWRFKNDAKSFHTDGELWLKAANVYEARGASWMLEWHMKLDNAGNVVSEGYILYTNVRSLKRLKQSFVQSGIKPVRRGNK